MQRMERTDLADVREAPIMQQRLGHELRLSGVRAQCWQTALAVVVGCGLLATQTACTGAQTHARVAVGQLRSTRRAAPRPPPAARGTRSSSSPEPSSVRTSAAAPPCTHRQLRLRQVRGQGVSSAEDLLAFQVANIGPRPCLVDRYPAMVFFSSRDRVVPFRVQPAKPVSKQLTMLLRPRKPAVFQLVVVVCLSRRSAIATQVRFTIPGTRGTYLMPLRRVRLGSVGWPYCGTPNWPDPVGVFPISGR